MSSELAPGTVTTADLYRELVGMRSDITKALTRIEVIESRNGDAHTQLGDHETRIRTLERFRFTLLGATMAVSTACGAVGGWIGYLLGHH